MFLNDERNIMIFLLLVQINWFCLNWITIWQYFRINLYIDEGESKGFSYFLLPLSILLFTKTQMSIQIKTQSHIDQSVFDGNTWLCSAFAIRQIMFPIDTTVYQSKTNYKKISTACSYFKSFQHVFCSVNSMWSFEEYLFVSIDNAVFFWIPYVYFPLYYRE